MRNVADLLDHNIGRYLDKRWDWDAFPSNAGFPELARAQMRYIGAGGSPKTDDRATLPPGAFTCSLIYQEPGRRAAVHHHQIEELFFVHRGTLTMTWQFGDETIDFTCGPGDAILNPASRPHGFRNDGPEDCVLQIMVATAAPMHPTYTDHPADHAATPLRPHAPGRRAEYLAEIDRFLMRATNARVAAAPVTGGAFTSQPYMTGRRHGGLVTASHFSFAVDTLTRGARTPAYVRDVEEAFMVIDGVLDIELAGEDGSELRRLGPRDLVLIPAGIARHVGNQDAQTVRFASIVGDPEASPIGWEPQLAAART